MKKTIGRFRTTGLLAAGILAATTGRADAEAQSAKSLLDASGVRGGIVVHVGCGDGRLTADLRAHDGLLVHGLDADAGNVEAARAHVRSRGLYGPVSIAQWDGGRLPYVENFVNLIIMTGAVSVPEDELLRVLAPHGVALAGGKRIAKPRPPEIDEWTHYLHGPGNNAVANDTVVDVLTRMQWLAGPAYSRHHDHMSGASAMVTAGGRLFYIFEESHRASILTAPRWFLYARDAFNGTLLWKRPIERWHEHMYPLKSGPQILPRRLVAIGDRVYVTLNIDDPVSELDAATGETLRVFADTAVAEEILVSDGMMIAVVAAPEALRSDPKRIFGSMAEIRDDVTGGLWGVAPRSIAALDLESGTPRWRHESPLMPLTLAAGRAAVVFHDGDRIVSLDRSTGRPQWASDPVPNQKTLRSSAAPTLVLADDVIVYSGYATADGRKKGDVTTMFALSAADGRKLWDADHLPSGHVSSPRDIFVIGGTVWHGATSDSRDSGMTVGRDLRTGELLKEFPPNVETHWFHQRCYRQKATERFLLYSRTGIEFVDFDAEDWTCHHWVRGACLYGIMPANGMIYNPPHPCACYLDAKLFGFNALAPASSAWAPSRTVSDEGRLSQGPACDTAVARAAAGPEEWPTYRGNPARTGFVRTAVPSEGLGVAWTADMGARISAPVIAGGRVVVAAPDLHEVHALDAEKGTKLWSFVAGGRVDSAPTLWEGRVLFGAADGYVYCLRAADGALAWRFRAAPEDRRHFAFEQIESVWPVHGSVLVQDGVLYCVAGRSMFLDGGLRLLRIDPATGRKLSETVMDERDPDLGENLQTHVKGLNMAPGLPDVLSSDGRRVYMRTQSFDLEGNRTDVRYIEVKDQQGDDRHIFSPTGFLDDSLWHRTYWVYGRAFASGAGGYYQAGRLTPSGRILVADDDRVYGYGRLWQYYRWTTPMKNHLFAAPKDPEPVRMGAEPPKSFKPDGRPKGNMSGSPVLRFGYDWSDELPIQATAMALAGPTLFTAGPPKLVDEEDAVQAMGDPDMKARLAEQAAAYEGRRGALLAAVAAKDGAPLAAYRLDSAPVFDGLAAANGRLFLSTLDGKVLCIAAGEGKPLPAASDAKAVPRGPDADKPVDSIPPATTTKASASARPRKTPAAPVGSREHPEFEHIAAATVAADGLGYRIVADEEADGIALRRLASPLTRQAVFKLSIRPTAEGQLQTGFLAFGDGTDPDRLVKCGIRVRSKKCYIIQGAGKAAAASAGEFTVPSDRPVDVEVAVNLEAKTLVMMLNGVTLEAPLRLPMKAITHVGYFVMKSATEFSPIGVDGL